MRAGAVNPADSRPQARILIIDDHEISREACRALLRAEGVDVVADLAADERAVAVATALRPDLVIVDVTPGADTGFDIAGRLRRLPDPPAVVLTSSAAPASFGSRLDGYGFVAKADIGAATIGRQQAGGAPGGSDRGSWVTT